MPVQGEYEPSTSAWVRDQVEAYEKSGGTEGTTLRDTGLAVVIVTNLGARSGKVRKTPVMRVEHQGRYAAVASKGGEPSNPQWYASLSAEPLIELQDGTVTRQYRAREVSEDERALWWRRAVDAIVPNPKKRSNAFFVIRLLALLALAWVIIKFLGLNIAAAALGLLVSGAAVVLEIIYELIYAS